MHQKRRLRVAPSILVKFRHQSRGAVSPATVGLVLAALSVGGLVVKVANEVRSSDGATRSASAAETAAAKRPPSADDLGAVAFYRDVKRSMSPLLNSAPLLSELVREVASGQTPAPTVSGVAHDWAESFATTRDLVGRLQPRSEGSSEQPSLYQARSLYRLGAALYVESARAVPHLVAVAGRTEARQEALKAIARMQLLGDRAFDAGNRLLAGREVNDLTVGIRVDRLLPSEVPDFAELGLQAEGGPAAIRAPEPADRKPEPIASDRWVADHRDAVSSAVGVLRDSIPWLLSAPGDAPSEAVRSAADKFEGLARSLGGPLPSTSAAAEGVHSLRLALLVASESLRSLPPDGPGLGRDAQQSQRLRLIAEQFWGLATDLLVSGHAGTRSLYGLPPNGLDPELLRAGGVFNGRPPPLRPGEDPGKDVPNGLPPVAPAPQLRPGGPGGGAGQVGPAPGTARS
ncbi:MAG: hypothetical protein AB1679_00670 [Actinomycetota bacterium]